MALSDLLRRQDGLLSREQAKRYGLSTQAIRRRVRAGTWWEIHPGVYLVEGHALPPRPGAGRMALGGLRLRRRRRDDVVLGLPVGPWRIDVAFPAQRVAVEVDGWAWHSDPVRFARDREKGNAIVAAGWRLLRVTWRDCTRDLDATVRRIAAVLDRAA